MPTPDEGSFTTDRELVPTDYIVKPTGLRRVFHPSSLKGDEIAVNAAIAVGSGGFAGLVGAMLIEFALLPMNMALPGIPLLIGLSAALTPVAYGISAWKRTGDDDATALTKFSAMATTAVEQSLHPLDGKGDRDLRDAALKVIQSTDVASEELRRRATMRIAAIQRAYHRSLSRLGTASKDEAVRIRNEAVRALAVDAVREHEAVIQQKLENDARGAGGAIEDLRDEISGLLSIGAPKGAKILIAHTGTGRAHVDRLISKAEEALLLDPDMKDRSGARVDAAIREHLPRLLQKHADTAKSARVEDLAATDRMLDEGVELIRRSVEEGLEGIRNEKADALRTEIGFLRLRRSGVDGPLNPLDDGNRP